MSGPTKAYLHAENGVRIDCLFNPAELKVTKSMNWKAQKAKGKTTPRLKFQEGQSGKLTTELVFDTTSTGESVTTHTTKLMDLMRVDTDLSGSDPDRNRGRPPWVRFHWGDFHSFKAVLEQLEISFTYFSQQGVPLRARAQVTLTQYEDEQAWAPQNPTSGTPTPHRVHRVQPGESIDRVAARQYGDATRWRLLADANGIDDPFDVAAGRLLLVPEPGRRRRA